MIERVLQEKQKIIHEALGKLLTNPSAMHVPLFDSMRYSLLLGGKRIRPILFLLFLDIFGEKSTNYMSIACALECIHTYSLIHDDLPEMDNDDYRRGQLTNHKKFGAALALLAGDGLLTYAFTLIAQSRFLSAEKKIKLVALLARAAGAEGMVGGQAHDKMVEGVSISLKELQFLDACKTGALLAVPVEMACEIAEVSEEIKKQGDAFSYHVGLLFQITDDLLDLNGHLDEMGKMPKQDVIAHKSTYVTLLGEEKAKKWADLEAKKACEIGRKIDATGLLEELVLYILHRNK